MEEDEQLTSSDRFEIFEQLNRHQRYIDNDATLDSARKYVDLYWPEATFTVHDLRHVTFARREGLKKLYDYAHSVFPLHKWSHSVGAFVIGGSGNEATAEWRWAVSWKGRASFPQEHTTISSKSGTGNGSAWSAFRISIQTGRERCFSRLLITKRTYSKRLR